MVPKLIGCGALAIVAACEFPRPADVSDFSLTVSKTGAGSALGTVSSTPAGIECGADCAEAYPLPTSVTLTATAGAGASFTGWTGDGCAGTEPCVVVVDGARVVTADFAARFPLTVVRAGAGGGTITGAGIACGSDCAEEVAAGAMVTLTAAPDAGELFFGWSGGGCSGTGDCTVTVTAATTVTATFDECVRGAASCTVATGGFTACGADGGYVAYAVPNGGAGGAPTTITMHDYACPLGCHGSGLRCLDVSASNGLNAALDAPATSPTGLDLALTEVGDTVINTSSYDPVTQTTQVTPPSGTAIAVPARIVVQVDAPEILVLEVRTLTIGAGATVIVQGTRALGVTSHFDIYLAGHLKASGAVGGAGQSTYLPCHAPPTGVASSGGGNVASGGGSSTSAPPGVFQSNPTLIPLQGGCRSGTISAGVLAPQGSNGGGAIQLVSRTRVVLGAMALVNVAGARGVAVADANVANTSWVTGGGSGGSVLLEAPGLSIAAGATVHGRGGSGGASNRTSLVVAQGNHGDIAGATVPGATCAMCGRGGDGGSELGPPIQATGSGAAIGGGGGAVGRCVVRNRSGAVSPPPGSMKISVEPTLVLNSR